MFEFLKEMLSHPWLFVIFCITVTVILSETYDFILGIINGIKRKSADVTVDTKVSTKVKDDIYIYDEKNKDIY